MFVSFESGDKTALTWQMYIYRFFISISSFLCICFVNISDIFGGGGYGHGGYGGEEDGWVIVLIILFAIAILSFVVYFCCIKPRRCSRSNDKIDCYLCLKEIDMSVWQEHRKQCALGKLL